MKNPRQLVSPDPIADPADPITDTAPPADGGGSEGGESEVDRLRRALEASRTEARQFRTEARHYESQLKEVGTTNPALLEDARRKAEEAEQRRQLAEQQADAKVQAMQRQLEERTAKTISEANAARQAAEREALRVKTERDFLAAEGLVDASAIDGRTPFDYVWQLYGPSVAEDAQGRYVKDENGLPMTDQETGKRLTLKDFFGKLRDDHVHGQHFKPRYGAGGGSRSGFTGRLTDGRDLDKLSSKEMLEIGLKEARDRQRRTA
jgi:hypothetical protein